MSYQMVKLSNGEDIICNVEDENGHILIISSPLKMETYNRTTEKGMIESLGLSRWIQPYSDEDEFTIHKNTIVLMTPVSAGLKRYYEYVLKSMEDMDLTEGGPTEKEIKVIEFDHNDVVRHPLVSKIIRAYQKKSIDDKD